MNKFKLVDTARSKSKLVARLVSTFSKDTYIVLHKGAEGRMTDSDIVDLILSRSSDPEKFKKYVKSRVNLLFSKISEFNTGYLVIDLDEVTCLNRLVFIITYKLSNGTEIPVSLPKVNERGYAVDALFTTTTDQVYSDKIILKGSESISSSGNKHFFSRNEEYFDDLTTIKSELFSAPDEVKKSFNNLVKFFSNDYEEVRAVLKTARKYIKNPKLLTNAGVLTQPVNLTDKDVQKIKKELMNNLPYGYANSGFEDTKSGFSFIGSDDLVLMSVSNKGIELRNDAYIAFRRR